ncbi:monocarboxylate transporter 12-like [Ptychodera flava]|uniref:monocarboxylate transporter 12-like n=1 Tax=Ptychodera flava TaxID=63121 RepID=UPI003969F9BA
MAAGVLASLGIFASAFTTKLYQLYITYGLISGIGLGLTYVLYIEIVSIYFNKRFSVAIGLALQGTGAGQLFFSIVTQMLVDQYGWRGTLLILSGMVSNACVVGALLRPLKVGYSNKPRGSELRGDESEEIESYEHGDRDVNTDKKSSQSETNELPSSCDMLAENDDANDSGPNRLFPGCLKSCLIAVYDFSLFKSPMFVVIGIIVVAQGCGTTASNVHIVRRARDYGISDTQSAYIPAAMGLAQMVGQTCIGAVSHVKKISKFIPYTLCMFLAGISLILGIYIRNFTAQIVFIVVFGICNGGYIVLNSIMAKLLFGSDRLGHAMSLLNVMQGMVSLFFSPLGGWIRDSSNIYDGYYWLAGGLEIFASVLAATLPLVDRISKRGQCERKSQSEDADADMKVAHKLNE